MEVATKEKYTKRKLSPDTGKVSIGKLTKGASVSRNEKNVFYRTTVNTGLSFLNEVKNPGRVWRY